MIIGLTGLARSGKDVIAEYICDKYNFKHLDFARDALFAKADEKGIDKTDKMALSVFGDELRVEGGKGVLAKIISKKMDDESDYVITGFRSPEEVDFIRNECEDEFWLVEIFADKLYRFERRKENDQQNMDDFFARDTRDIHNKGLGEVLKIADFKLENEGTLEELFEKTDDLMKRLGL